MTRHYTRSGIEPGSHNAAKIAQRAAAMQQVHAVLAKGPLSAQAIAALLSLNQQTVYGYLRQLEGEGYVRKTGQQDANGRQTWMKDDASTKQAAAHASRACIVPARQIGVKRDPFIAALFGPAAGGAA